ncbi:MAG: hypothetical protein ACRCWW_14305 [Scandinavium sp.]|uniref:hypothetical protein n=1 Tax=Scandinavium sp. TaxID=2830653 RepID=UPI003F3A4223
MTIEQITAAYPNVAKLEEAAHEEIMCREVCDTSDKWQDEASPEAVLALTGLGKQLAEENAGLKSKGRELLGEACAVYAKLNKLIDPTIGDFVDGQTLHEFQFVLDVETPATDRFLAEQRAQGVEQAAQELEAIDTVASTRVIALKLREFAQQLRVEKAE